MEERTISQRIATFAIGVAAMLLMLVVMMMMLVAVGCASSEHYVCPNGQEISKYERCPVSPVGELRPSTARQRLAQDAPRDEQEVSEKTEIPGDRAPDSTPNNPAQ